MVKKTIEVLCIKDMYMEPKWIEKEIEEALILEGLHSIRCYTMGHTYYYVEQDKIPNDLGDNEHFWNMDEDFDFYFQVIG